MITPIAEIGRALWGERWQTEMARALAISDRHIRRLTAGTAPVSPGIFRDLLEIAQSRENEIQKILPLIKALMEQK